MERTINYYDHEPINHQPGTRGAREVTATRNNHPASNAGTAPVNLQAIKRSVSASIDEAIRELREQPLEGVATGVVLTAAVLIMNTQWTHLIARMLASKTLVMQASALVAAPLLEELVKHLSIKKKATASYFLTSNLQEFATYTALGVSPHLRIPAVVMHLATTLVQKHYCMLAAESANEDRAKTEITGYGFAVAAHAMFNAVAMRR